MGMPFTCPNCARTGRVPDGFTGNRIKCPACQTICLLDAAPTTIVAAAGAKPCEIPPGPTPDDNDGEDVGSRWPVAWIAGGGVAAALLIGGVAFLLLSGGGKDGARVPVASTNPPPSTPTVLPVASGDGPASKPAEAGRGNPEPSPTAGALAKMVAGATAPLGGPSTAGASPSSSPGAEKLGAREGVSQAETIQRAKDATVFIRVGSGRINGSGSGFVIREEGDSVLIATNHHVVYPEGEAQGAGDPRRPSPTPMVTVVFRSGEGPGAERTLPAAIVAADGEGTRDLAILRVRGLKDAPRPIPIEGPASPAITTPVLICGFPFGNIDRAINPSARGNPSITINRGFVSSLKNDGPNRVSHIQIDGSINPGNSGGPVVDESGRLVGVAVAKINNTTIGFAIPAAELARMLQGRLGAIRLEMRGERGGQADLTGHVRLIDPLKHIRSAELLYAPAMGLAPPPPDGQGHPLPLSGAQALPLALSETDATGNLQVPVASLPARRLLVQAAYHLDSGEVYYTSPLPYSIPTRPSVATGIRAEPAADRGPVSTFAALGPLVDSLNKGAKDCQLIKADDSMKIEVPAGCRLINSDYDSKGAAMSLADVEGDFIAVAKVGGTMIPGTDPLKYKGRPLTMTFQGAGLVLWQDSKNYICIERTAKSVKGRAVLTSEALLEIVKAGKPVASTTFNIPDGPLFVRIQRVDGALSCLFGPDGRRWITHRKLALTFPEKVQVGLIASNLAREPLTAQFDSFVLVRDRDDVAERREP